MHVSISEDEEGSDEDNQDPARLATCAPRAAISGDGAAGPQQRGDVVVSSGAAQTWFIAGTIPFILAGGVHFLATLVDLVRPTFFAPIERSLIGGLEGTGIRFRAMFPGGSDAAPSLWRAWLGFNLSHGLGALTFGLLSLLVASYDFELVTRIDAMLPLAIGVAGAYLVLALRFWFYVPAITIGAGTVCFAVAGALSL